MTIMSANTCKCSDKKLLRAYKDGDQRAMSVLIDRHRRRVSDYIYMMVRDRTVADDIFQETLIKVLKFLAEGRYIDNGKFLSWVLRIAHNQVIDHFRQRKQKNHLNDADTGHDIFNDSRLSDPTIEQCIISEQIEEDVRTLVNELPHDQREVIVMRYFDGLSFREIADQTEVSINTALGRMRYALINLRKKIRERQMTLTAS